MAGSTASGGSAPNWHLQSRRRAQPHESLLNDGGFREWTNVPPVGVPDVSAARLEPPALPPSRQARRRARSGLRRPWAFESLPRQPHIANQMKYGRRYEYEPQVSVASDPWGLGAGKRIVAPHEHAPVYDGRRHYPTAHGLQSTEEQQSRGVKCVPSRAKRAEAGGANPNQVAKHVSTGVEGVKMFPGSNSKDYNCWEPQDLHKAQGGDWGWNTQFGFRKVAKQPNGEQVRAAAHPVAWPLYPGYPPDREAATGTRIDYALARNGGIFASAVKGAFAHLAHPLTTSPRPLGPLAPSHTASFPRRAPGPRHLASQPRRRLRPHPSQPIHALPLPQVLSMLRTWLVLQ